MVGDTDFTGASLQRLKGVTSSVNNWWFYEDLQSRRE